MTRRPTPQAFQEEAHAAMARVFGVDVEIEDPASTAPEPPAEESEGRVALGRVFGTEA
jgi:hypothetical protein